VNADSSFDAPWDGLVRGITGGTILLAISIVVVVSVESDNPFLASGVVVLLACVLVLPFLWAPRSYVVEANHVVVKRLIGETRITVADEPRRWNWTWQGIRLWGSGGLYGYFGHFAFRGIGRVHMHATNRHNFVLIRDERSQKHVVSPDQPEKFILLLRR
jgi:hypothetical protein